MKILITGATGFVGKELGLALAREGHELVVISRRKKSASQCPFPCTVVEGDLVQGPISSPALQGVEAVFHLMGEPVAQGRWTPEKKASLVSSRIDATRHLRMSLKKSPKVLVSASAIGYFADRGEEELTDHSPAGTGFLADLCSKWEKEAEEFSASGARVAIARIGIVIGREGGALAEMLPIFRHGLGGPINGGKAWMSWIHRSDLVAALLFALHQEKVKGVFNAVAPNPVRNKEFTAEFSRALGRPAIFPVPGFGLKLLFGEKSAVILSSQRVLPKVLEGWGFTFRHPTLAPALVEELGPLRGGNDLLVAKQYVPEALEKLFPFFAEAGNLEDLTPASLNFRILSVNPPTIQTGTLIRYALKIHGVPVKWLTRIESWSPPHSFVDNQLKGPYSLWHHTHDFEKLGQGTLMVDTVRFRLPLGFLGETVAGWWVRGDVAKIFDYRREVIDGKFGRRKAAL
jgi:uncharacterized protein